MSSTQKAVRVDDEHEQRREPQHLERPHAEIDRDGPPVEQDELRERAEHAGDQHERRHELEVLEPDAVLGLRAPRSSQPRATARAASRSIATIASGPTIAIPETKRQNSSKPRGCRAAPARDHEYLGEVGCRGRDCDCGGGEQA
jgi:hypothetical protein